jgi:lipoprotein-anchoring transpeptidase ErfK/SrfK
MLLARSLSAAVTFSLIGISPMNTDMLSSLRTAFKGRIAASGRTAGLVSLVVVAVLAPSQLASAKNTVAAQAGVTTPAPTTPTLPNATTPGGVKVAAVTIVASAKAAVTPAYDSPTATKPFFKFNNKTNFSGRHVFIVLAQQGDSFKVLLPMRPNGRTGYVKAKDVNLYQHDYAAVVSVGTKTLTLYKSGVEVLKDTVAVGSAKYPTPLGSFYMRELARPRNPNGAYGPWAFGLSAYSNVLQTFGRGDGQIGIHGTNQPKLLGQNVSHGCIRMRNATIIKLAKMLPQGVPVEIVA